MSNYQKLLTTLREIFQLDQAELDFGIYRILNQKRSEINAFLEKDLLPQVKQVLKDNRMGDAGKVEQELQRLEKSLYDAGMNPDDSPKVQELRAQYRKAGDLASLENEVFSHLATFFSRYYHQGDFISQRRYKKDVYAIPYEGEEVKLYWANHDQYYIKTSEYLQIYRFKLPGGKPVSFRLVDASTEQDNRKASSGKERRFQLSPDQPVRTEEEELIIQFLYQPTGKVKQKELNKQALQTLAQDQHIPPAYAELWTKKPTEKNKNRTLLEKHLTDYTARNTFDYFIHKDLDGFLTRELDFYLKNEVLHLDDIATRDERYFLGQIAQLKAIKQIGSKLIAFLAQLETFQKKLWLKKKFITQAEYCLTLDHVPEELYPKILNNQAQIEAWKQLFHIEDLSPAGGGRGGEQTNLFPQTPFSNPLTIPFLQENPYLVLDTAFFSPVFKHRLLASIDDLDAKTDGLLINSENFQALNLLQERYREQVKCVYIDPPYNTGDDGFPYKDNYPSSSWLSMILDRLNLGRGLQTSDGTITLSIDDIELYHLNLLLRNIYSGYELANLVWDKNRKNDARFFSVGHEYMLIYAKNKQLLVDKDVWFREPKEGIKKAQALFEKLSKKYGDDLPKIQENWRSYFRKLPKSSKEKKLGRFSKIDIKKGPYRDDGNISWPGGNGPKYEVLHPVTGKPCKIPDGGWRYSKPERFWEEVTLGKVGFGPDETTLPRQIRYLFDADGQVMPSVFYSYAQTATMEFLDVMGNRVFANPKNWRDLYRIINYLADKDSIILDYFAGSGTTGHAIINLNREDGGQRKYILVEMGQYFDTVTKPRIQKVIYSKDWKDGKPVSREGSSHIFKYLRLESYEDSLNNLQLRRSDQQQSLLSQGSDHLREGYLLHYLLDTEAQGSLLSVADFADPFSYSILTTVDDELKPTPVDLIETFNYLIGLVVETREVVQGYHILQGHNLAEERILIIWRNVHKQDAHALNAFLRKSAYNPLDQEFDRIYVNGDNHIENLKQGDERWKVVLIEEAFLAAMWEGTE